MTAPVLTPLLDFACEPYRRAGRFAYHFARGKLGSDPVFRAILEHGLLTDRVRILDLGCGQGLLTAWLKAAQLCYQTGSWPQGWPPAPQPVSTRGIADLRHRLILVRRGGDGRGRGHVAQA